MTPAAPIAPVAPSLRILVIGSGLAGLIAAVRATDAGHSVTLVTKQGLPDSNTRYAQGGIAAAMFPDDSVDLHILDTLRAGAGLCDPAAVEVLCGEGPARVRDLIRFGVDFDRDDSGVTRGLEAAHSRSRVLHAGGDATGAAIEAALVSTVRERAARSEQTPGIPRVQIREHTMLVDLLVAGDRVTGASLLGPDGLVHRVDADAVILATGGAGSLFPHTTNPALATGDGVAAAWRAGAAIADLEFYQFHPTALAVPGTPLVSEAVRGEGAVLLNARGERFMLAIHPGAELAPRDIVARSIAREMSAQGGTPVLLDATGLGRELLETRFPTITAACLAAGIDWAVEPIPVAPAAHYWMGGVSTDLWGRTSLPGLYAVGETARTGTHGANRLASNSLLEAAVFADRAVRALGTGQVDADGRRLPSVPASSGTADATVPARAVDGPGAHVDRAELQRLMWDAAGVLRDGDGLAAASAALAGWKHPAPAGQDATPADRVRAVEDANLLDLARVAVASAFAREESRGAHYRADFPESQPELAHSQEWVRPADSDDPFLVLESPERTREVEEAIAC
ncbi:L-aspartate oxidase [Cryobacterium sp. GrIS_2_6]|uniref:L-aspartate oxidase n=1 Tax=Cryobacterium sp. GrIS_2_6 TaxID=3162785 RepID=UPI002DFF9AFB|nr:L-aspartate oxidase [Cryobacterium psychrotolerans]MEC5148679.1 L-aspartate oxidase [Cryobacterium psychrotolerans]